MRPGRRLFVGLLVVYVLGRLYLASLPGYTPDLIQYKRWALMSTEGFAAVYEHTDVDYPPGYLYVLRGIGGLYRSFHPGIPVESVPDARLFTFLIKLPPLFFDLMLAVLIWRVARPMGYGRTAVLTYLCNPAIVWVTGYWGHPDSLVALLCLGSLLALSKLRVAAGAVLLALAGLSKPLAAPLLPLLGLAVWLGRGWRGLLKALSAGLTAGLLLMLPFVASGRLTAVLGRILGDLDAMPLASINAHNLWWLLGGSRLPATEPWLGGLTPVQLGLTLFATLAAILLYRARTWLGETSDAARLITLAAALSAGFFGLSAMMHENHLFLALAFLIAASAMRRELTPLVVAATTCLLINLALHDLTLPYSLPGFLGAASPVTDPLLHRPYTWVQLIGSGINSVLCLGVTGWIALTTWHKPTD